MTIFILQSTLTNEEKESLVSFFRNNNPKKHKLNIIDIDNSVLEKVPILRKDFSKEAYYKLLIPEVIPNDIERAIYLDVDMICTGSIQDMYKIDMQKAAIAAVPDYFVNKNDKEYMSRLGLDKDEKYFNSGMILFDMNRLREVYRFEDAQNYISNNGSVFKFHDQEVLNALLHRFLYPLPEAYNYLSVFRDNIDIMKYVIVGEKKKNKPRIIHFAGGIKPWDQNYWGKYQQEYVKWLVQVMPEKKDLLKRNKLNMIIEKIR